MDDPDQAREESVRMTRKQRRLTMIGSALAVLGFAAGLVLYGFSSSIKFFSTPSMTAEQHIAPGQRFRLGGLVQPGSLNCGHPITFAVADGSAKLTVSYAGILPDLFREGQGVVAEGALEATGIFQADSILAKHDENYMPKDVAETLKKQGHWMGGAMPVDNAGATTCEARKVKQ
jgi:cytochrome c-type biogenesis protein CcmE